MKISKDVYNVLYKVIHDLYLKAHEKIIAAKNNGVLFSIPYERINVEKTLV